MRNQDQKKDPGEISAGSTKQLYEPESVPTHFDFLNGEDGNTSCTQLFSGKRLIKQSSCTRDKCFTKHVISLTQPWFSWKNLITDSLMGSYVIFLSENTSKICLEKECHWWYWLLQLRLAQIPNKLFLLLCTECGPTFFFSSHQPYARLLQVINNCDQDKGVGYFAELIF